MTSRSEAKPAAWQPIETAPMDGTTVIVSGRWGSERGAVFVDADSWDGATRNWCGHCFDIVTHWMPLPDPPDAESNGSSKNLSTEGMVE